MPGGENRSGFIPIIQFQGDIHVCGLEATHDHEKILKIVGYMPSEAWFYPEMTVKDVLELSAQTPCNTNLRYLFLTNQPVDLIH